MMKAMLSFIFCTLITLCACTPTPSAGGGETPLEPVPEAVAEENLIRAMEIVDAAVDNYFTGTGMTLSRYYNPLTKSRSSETGSVWMYTASIEAVNAIMGGLISLKEYGNPDFYNAFFNKYFDLLGKLYDNLEYYRGTFTLTSYTQTREWSVYGVNRGRAKGTAEVEGVMNVYDDQQWLVRELLESYENTGKAAYLEKAEYLTQYILDGWDCTLDSSFHEYGGITWGPGYTTKHACSNGPMVSPLVWLYEIYRGKSDVITHRYIDIDGTRKTESIKKSSFYVNFAKEVYQWQKSNLKRSDGVYDDLMGGCSDCDVRYEEVDGVSYRKHTALSRSEGPAYSYNSGTMLSGGADLYRVTGEKTYVEDLTALSTASFGSFAKRGANLTDYYTYDVTGFNNWFNGVLMRGWVDAYNAGIESAETPVSTFQSNLDYAYDNFLNDGMLPTNLLLGWNVDKSKNSVEAMFTFAFAAEYAVLAQYELNKANK